MSKLYKYSINYLRQVNWTLLLFLLLVLNVKLVVKVAALVIIAIIYYKKFPLKTILRHRLSYFYGLMILIVGINFLWQLNETSRSYLVTASFGIGLWVMAALAGFFIYSIVKTDEPARLHRTIEFFFLLHIAAIALNLFLIILETGSLNPYTYKGMNQKYYISTGDFIRGISFDSPVCTAMISAFALLYFLYRQNWILSIAAMASLLVIGSNLTNLFLAVILLFILLFRSNKIQKSMVAVHVCLLILFITKISPQNNEYMGRFAYKMMGRPYDLPKKNDSPEFIKSQPDNLLTDEEQRKKLAILYIDSVHAATTDYAASFAFGLKNSLVVKLAMLRIAPHRPDTNRVNKRFYEYQPTAMTKEKVDRFKSFFADEYGENADPLKKDYNWNRPGKWIAGLQLLDFFRQHPSRLPLGTGIANFSSRTAFKATGLNIAGSFPSKYSYIHPWFQDNHLFLYLFYHSQQQPKHAAENTPDSTYFQLLGEYGVVGMLAFLLLYLGYFVKRIRRMTYGLPVLLLLLMAFLVEYWFEQLSIVILAECLLLLDIRSFALVKPGKEASTE